MGNTANLSDALTEMRDEMMLSYCFCGETSLLGCIEIGDECPITSKEDK